MKIPQNEIDVVYTFLNTIYKYLKNQGVIDDKTHPLTYVSNPFGNFKEWMEFHPTLAVGGSDITLTKDVLYLDTVNNQLVWYNCEVEGCGWHPVNSNNDELINAVI
jgi:hypothetical protein